MELDSIDKEIILQIMKGNTSAYAVWAAMKQESSQRSVPKKVLAYKNIYQRIINLANSKFIEEVDLVHMHGRRDFKVVTRHIDSLIPYILSELKGDDFKVLSEYISRSGLNRQAFEDRLSIAILNIVNAGNTYYDFVGKTLALPSKHIGNIRIEDIRELKLIPAKARQQPKRK